MNLTRFILKRIAQIIPMLLVVSVLAFALSNLSGGDPAEIAIRNTGGEVTPENLAAMRAELGLDKPIIVQYFIWLGNALRFNFGNSFISGKPVTQEIFSRFPNTLYLVTVASLLAIAIAIPIAMLSARHKNTPFDHAMRVITTASVSMPEFWLGLLLLYFFGVSLKIVPVIAGSKPANVFLPAFTMCLSYAAIYIRMLRSNLIEVNSSMFIKAARAKGMSKGKAMLRHGLKNAILPSLTLIATNFGGMISGSFAVETIFTWNGVAGYAIQSVKAKDFPVIQCYLMIIALTYILVNLAIDIVYMYIDPKIRIQDGRKLWFKRSRPKAAQST